MNCWDCQSFDLPAKEFEDMWAACVVAKPLLLAELAPDGFHLGFNIGEADYQDFSYSGSDACSFSQRSSSLNASSRPSSSRRSTSESDRLKSISVPKVSFNRSR
jgi:hypothetical protein